MLRRRTVLWSELSHRVVGKTVIVLLLCRMSARRGPMPPWTPSLLVSVQAFESSRPLNWNIALTAVVPQCQNPKFDGFCLCDPTDSWADDEKYECDVGWQAFQASCYKLTSEKIDWDTAQKTCQKMEANLVSIHTLPELEFIIRNLKRGDLSILYRTTLFPLSCIVDHRVPTSIWL